MYYTIIFWVVLILISSWILPRFYYERNYKKVVTLRILSFLMEAFAIALVFFPWLPVERGGDSGFDLAMSGDLRVITFLLLIGFAFLFFELNNKVLLKVGAMLHLIASVYFFVLMIMLFPESMKIEMTDMAPIFIVFVLLICNVSVLLLWHQLQKKSVKAWLSISMRLAILFVAGLIIFLGVTVGNEVAKVASENLVGNEIVISEEQAENLIINLPDVIEFKALLDSTEKHFSVNVEDWDSEWAVQVIEIVDDGDGNGHSATFAWYTVDKMSGEIEKSI